ncbi:hypothetical protein [Paucibacter sp. XJ19-41]|uniref:hypothetical protein n=1 Tax=Paucibacter sp. XJ19-41 TaxID=2927824 RepID=UPI00234A6AF8|nr:hypothetical protein [Paucibacter sp. XJ19-41]MDC6168650.1 hypothetical protein [Paucibacter sp. XJ19-41]
MDEAERRYGLGQFEPVLAGIDALLAAPAPETGLRLRALLLKLRSLSKFERFEAMLTVGQEALARVAGPSPERVELLALMSFAYNQSSCCEPALRAADLALRDALALGHSAGAAMALERVAMCYLWMGDEQAAERFMLEALGFQRQSAPEPRDLLRFSNTLHLVCAVHDAHLERGDHAAALAALTRSSRYLAEGERLAVGLPQAYLRSQWDANVLRWRRRRHAAPEVREQMRQLFERSSSQGWLILQLALQLELALLAEADGDAALACRYCEQLLQEGGSQMRRLLQLRGLQTQARCLRRIGQAEAADRVEQSITNSLQQRAEQAAAVQGRMAAFDADLRRLLAEADQARLLSEIRRLRQRWDEGQALRVPGTVWVRA